MDAAVAEHFRRMQSQTNALGFNRTTDSLQAISAAIAALGFGPGASLQMFGRCAAAMAASTTVITTDNLTAALPDDLFNDEFYIVVIHNNNAVGVAPEGEWRRISDFVGATQTFTTDAFSANVEATDLLMIVHESILLGQPLGRGTLDTSSATVPADSTRAAAYAWENDEYFKGTLLMPIEGDCRFQSRPIARYTAATGVFELAEPFSQAPGAVDYVILNFAYPSEMHETIDMIFALVRAMLVLTETSGTVTTDGAEQVVYVNNAPAGAFEPKVVKIDMTDSTVAEAVVVRLYYRILAGGGWIMEGETAFPGVQAIPLKNVGLAPNRFGVRVTLQRTLGGAQDYDWEVLYKD